ncbi:BREX system Lon protease-like protein BrxL [Salinibacter ruber]|uniref:BREX system Lon protease-like protein BrxL n=1 Tax=Salinibacter ruber TaxID=146919 RepID=UPI002073A455|nr:BREX system Lon protease-like protein BrxL [Salinibacter ruber]
MTGSSDTSRGDSRFSPSGGDRPPEGAVEDGEVSRAAKSGFEGWLVSKPRARRFASRHSVPHHVVEWILSRFRAEGTSGSEAARRARELLSERLAEAEDIELLKMEASSEGSVKVIDKVEGAFDGGRGEPVLSFSELGLGKVPVDKEIAEENPRLLKGGFYANVELSYVGDSDSSSPFRAADLRPLAPSGTDLLERLSAGRKHFSDAAWLYFLVRSVGLAAPSEKVGPRTVALALLRLVPLVQKRYSLVELGPRGTGKSYLYEDLTPHAYVLQSGTASKAQLFVHAGTGEAGLVAEYDAVCFDEVTTTSAEVGEIVSGLKGYLSSGASRRGKEEVRGRASVVIFGNIDRPVGEVLEEDGHLFAPLPEALGEDTAVMDRISAFLPGWEVPKLGPKCYASGLALPSDVLAECLKELRERNYVPEIRRRLTLKGNLTGRDRTAVWQTISGLVKLIHPSPGGVPPEEVADEVLRWAAWLGLEMRLRVRAQQHRLQPDEFEEGEFGFQCGEGGKTVAVRLPEE